MGNQQMKKTATENCAMRAGSLSLGGVMLGLVAGTWFGAYDLASNAPYLPGTFGVFATLLYAVVGAVFGLVVSAASWIAFRVCRVTPSPERVYAALLCVLACGFLMYCVGRAPTLVAIPFVMFFGLRIARSLSRCTGSSITGWCLGGVAVGTGVAWLSCTLGALLGPSVWRSLALVGGIVLTAVVVTFLRKQRIGLVLLGGSCFVMISLYSSYEFFNPTPAQGNGPTKRNSGPPNVVLIVLDTFRRDFLGCYGHSGNLTPYLDEMAGRSTLYEDAISPSPWTMPSHASMFTGYFAKTHGCSSQHHRWLDDDALTLSEMLSKEGFQTVSLVSNVVVQTTNLQQGFDTHVFLRRSGRQGRLKLTQPLRRIGAPARWVDKGSTDALIELDDWFRTDHDATRPMFLFVNVMEPHQPYLPPYKHRVAHLPEGRGYLEATRIGADDFDGLAWHTRAESRPKKVELARALYKAEIAYQDERVGQLMAIIEANIDMGETMVIMTADHGENLGEAGRWGHLFAMNDYLIRVPLLIQFPKLFPAGQRISGLCQLTDLVPTVFDVIERTCPVQDLPGRSLVPAKFSPTRAAFAQWWPQQWGLRIILDSLGSEALLEPWTAEYRVVRTDNYKFIWSSDGRHQLYDVKSDPDEATNIITRSPQLAAELSASLDQWWDALPSYVPKVTDGGAPIDPETLESLKSLGYVGD